MADKTGIEWTDATWNPIRGCSRVSEGCRNCYAERTAAFRHSGGGRPYEGLAVVQNGKPHWTGNIMFVEKHLLDPLKWKHPRRIFVNSMSDLFHENVTNEMLDKIFAVMALCPQHTFQVLTKRPKRMLDYFTQKHRNPQGWPAEDYDVQTCIRLSLGGKIKGKVLPNGCPDVKHFLKSGACDRYRAADTRLFYEWPLFNIWLGVSCEDQATADERIPLLLQTPAAVRFISAEPLLGPISLGAWTDAGLECTCCNWRGIEEQATLVDSPADDHWFACPKCDEKCAHTPMDECLSGKHGLNWVICGGESGPGARPMHPDWARSLRDQCDAANVPFFFKQWGEWAPGECVDRVSGTVDTAHWFDSRWDVSSENLARDEGHVDDEPDVYRIGKKAAGSMLDGVDWKQFPEVRA